jgi:hypothetical protein
MYSAGVLIETVSKTGIPNVNEIITVKLALNK